MVPELEKPRVTEINVRMDCNGCVQKIKKALHGINGIYDLYVDFPQQKITIIGWADPEKIVKVIRKTRKSAIICSHIEQQPDKAAQESESSTQAEAPAPDSANQAPEPEPAHPPPTESPPAQEAPQPEPPKDSPPQENPQSQAKPSPDAVQASASHPSKPAGPKDVEEVHVIYHHPPDYGYRYSYNHNMAHGYGGEWHSYPSGEGFTPQTSTPVYVTHSYNTYRPSPYVTGYESVRSPPQYANYTHSYNTHRPSPYVTGYNKSVQSPPQYANYIHSYNTHRPSPYVTGHGYVSTPPQYENFNSPPQYENCNRFERRGEDYHTGSNGNGNVTSIFSDENPNACTIA